MFADTRWRRGDKETVDAKRCLWPRMMFLISVGALE